MDAESLQDGKLGAGIACGVLLHVAHVEQQAPIELFNGRGTSMPAKIWLQVSTSRNW